MDNESGSPLSGFEKNRESDLEFLLQWMEEVATMGSYQIELATMKFWFSAGMYKIFGEEPQCIKPSLEFILSRSHPEDVAAITGTLDAAINSKQAYRYNSRIQGRDGEWQTLESSGKVMDDEKGCPVKVFVVVQDITGRKKAEAELDTNRAILKQSEEIAPIGSWEYDVETRKMRWSQGMYELFELDRRAKIEPEIYLDFVVPEDRPRMKAILEKIKTELVPFEDGISISVGGKRKRIQLKTISYNDKEGKPLKMLGVDLDITERIQAEAKLRLAEEQKQQEILNAVMQTQEEERRRIAESLHNEFGHLLSIARLKLPEGSHEAEELLNKAIKLVRSISHELMPAILKDFGLEAALRDLFGSKLKEVGIQHSFAFKGSRHRINSVDEVAVFRIVQEIIQNVIKHAKASFVNVSFTQKSNYLTITIEDNGIGMKTQEASKKGFGLSYISNRIHLLKGKLTVSSEETKGTKFLVEIPL